MPLDPPDRIAEIRVDTTAGCPGEAAFLALVAERAPPDWRIQGSPGERAVDQRFGVTFALEPSGTARGTLEGGGEARSIEGASCTTVAEAVAFSLVLRLREAMRAPPISPKAEAAPPPRPPPAAQPAPTPERRSFTPWFEAGTELSAAWGTAPNPLGGGLFVGAGATLGAFTPGLRATLVRGFVGRPDAFVNAGFEAYGLRFDTCPVTARVWRLRISPCLGVGISALALQTGLDVIVDIQDLDGSAPELANPRVNVLAIARTTVRTVDPLLLELSLGLTANPIVEGYSFEDHAQAWEGSVLGPFVAAAVGVSIE